MAKVAQLVQINDSAEVTTWHYLADRKYILGGINYGARSDGKGGPIIVDVENKQVKFIREIGGWAHWVGIYLTHRKMFVQFGQQSEKYGNEHFAVTVTDVEKLESTCYVYPNKLGSGDEFVSAVYDYKNRRFIVGTCRGFGMIFLINEEDLDKPDNWRKIYQFKNNPEITDLAIFNDTLYIATCVEDGEVAVYTCPLDEIENMGQYISKYLTSYAKNTFMYTAVGKEGLYIPYSDNNGKVYIRKINHEGGEVDIETPLVINTNPSKTKDWHSNLACRFAGGNVLISWDDIDNWVFHLLFYDVESGAIGKLVDGENGRVDKLSIAPNHENVVYFGVCDLGGRAVTTPCGVYSLIFDKYYKLVIEQMPSKVSPNKPFGIKVKVLDENGNPVPQVTVCASFVDALEVDDMHTVRDPSCTTTDNNGEATVYLTAPGTLGKYLIDIWLE